ncbi:hypothetical protein [Nostoc sp. DedSLP04]|nr:hypothetical protein [Nostoc sp. DedSLP04]MDZ8030710.1 hypothetical protein [Nostoc sp. DedSLP04]
MLLGTWNCFAQCPLALSDRVASRREAVRVASRREGMPHSPFS